MIELMFLAIAMQSAGGVAAQHSTLHYALGGTMSGPIALDIDLDTGDFSLNQPVAAFSKDLHSSQGRLPAPTLRHLRELAASALRNGFDAERCRMKGYLPRTPIDAIRDMTVHLDGQLGSAPPNPECWSKSADNLQAAAFEAVRQP